MSWMKIKQGNNHFPLFISLLILVFITIAHQSEATHIRAGEITARRIDNITLTFEFTFTGFRDTSSPIHFGSGKFDFGDGNSETGGFRISSNYIGNNTDQVEWKIVHTYEAPGSYIVSYQEANRNPDVINMDNSVNTPFYVETKLVIDPFFGLNNTPVMTVPPIDLGAVGVTFIHNPGAFDPDGDSLSYKFTTCKQSKNLAVNNYRELINSDFYIDIPYDQGNQARNDNPKLTLDPVAGNLIWDAPGDDLNLGDRAEYNVAFVIEEWRYIPSTGEWAKLGYVTRDMQIIIKKTDNQQPELVLPKNVCVEAGKKVQELIQGTDPDGQQVKIEAFGGPFEVSGNKATYSPNPAEFQDQPAFMNFEWDTQCGHVRLRPYDVQFKVTDNPDAGPQLVNFATFEITVVGPPPRGLKTDPQVGRSIKLEWDRYTCTNAEKMQIWRRVGSFDIQVDDCTIGMPPNTGYQKIDEVVLLGPGNTPVTSYVDDNNGKGLAPGAKYCYRLVATYPLPGGGESYVSAEVCDSILLDAPAITNVDIKKTDESSGEIFIRWVPPYQIDQTTYPPAYTYDVFRGVGLSDSKSYNMVASNISDTTYTDVGLNTTDSAYNYFIRLYDANGFLVDSSATASSVRLEPKPLLASIQLNWSADVPWSNTVEQYPIHYVYRDQADQNDAGKLVLIDSVDVTKHGYTYLDRGQFNGVNLDEKIQYCYYVTTNGSYGNSLLPEPLINNSQIACAQPNDTIPPCKPPSLTLLNANDCEAILANAQCGIDSYTQTLNWTVDTNDKCDNDIVHYNIYFSETGNEVDYTIIGTSVTNSFERDGLKSIKGCFKVTAVDRSGNESEFTEEVCTDNCPVYILPNVFTPNNDGYNDVFSPIHGTSKNESYLNENDCPRFIEKVNFRVFDTTGNELYVYDSYENQDGIYINWDGKNKFGEDLPAGVYFYLVTLEQNVLNPKDTRKVLKGWVQLLR